MTALAFDYRATDKAGRVHRGQTGGVDKSDAIRRLASLGLTPVEVRPARGSARAAGASKSGRSTISRRDLAHFTYQLGVLVSARIPLSDGLMSLGEQERPGALRELIMDIAMRVRSGSQIAAALEHHERDFGPVYISTIRAAETTGTLPTSLEHLSDMLEREQETSRQVKGSLMYPACIVGVLALAVLFLVGFVVPQFADMFEKRNLPLPTFTQALMLFARSVRGYWFGYVGAIAAAVYLVRHAWATAEGRRVIDLALHRVPYIRSILIGHALARFTRVLGLSLSSGLGLIEALQLAGAASGRPTLAAQVDGLSARIRGGGRLIESLASCPYLTPFAVRMLTAGESSGELPRMCSVVSKHYDRETTHLAKNLGTVIEPVLIVAIAGVVLVIALAIFMPMWDMVKLVGG